MACRYTYKGKTYEAWEFEDVLKAMSPAEASAFMPGINPVPDSPFVTKTEGWLNLALKRIMAMAVDGGYDRVAFVNGEQSADRYDLSKQISGVEWRTRKVASKGSMSSRPEQGRLIAVDHDKNRVVDEEIHESRLEEYVGKEVAEKLLEQPVTETTGYGEDVRVLGGLDLKVGGEGMKTFYDRIVPNATNALLKKVSGEKLGMVRIPLTTEQSSLDVIDSDGELILRTDYDSEAYATARENPGSRVIKTPSIDSAPEQLGFDVTPKLIDSATQGFTLFSRARQVNDAADYSTDILGEAIQKPKRSKPAPAAELPPGEYAVSTALVTTRKQKIGTKQVKTSQDAADALHYLTRGAVERFDAIVTNAKGKPLSIIGGFKGAVSQASVYPATIMGEAIQIPGAANIWFVHNHPSGSSDLSAADHNLHKLLSEVFDGSGITPRELLAVTPSEWSDTAGATDLPNPRDDGATVPVQEREIVRDERLGFPIESPRFALKAAQELAKRNGNRPGLMLLNARNAPVAYVPWEPAGTEILKEQGRLGSLYRAVSEANAASVILVDPMGEFGRQQWRNLAKAFKQADVRMLDVMQGERSVAETDGLGFPPEILRSKQRKDFTIEVSSRGETATAKVGSRVVGKAHAWMDSRDKFVIMNTEVREKYRRRGIASAMYRAIEEASGRQLTPAVSLSDDAFELWKSFRPEAVAQDLRHWKDQIIGARVLYRGDSGRIVKADGGTAIMEFDQPKENGSTQRVILRQNLNEALDAAGSPTIDFDSAGIKRSTGRTSTGAAWDSPSAEKFDDLVYKLQDKQIDTKRVVEAIKEASGAIADDLNVYLREELFHGRAAKRTEDFANMELTPLIEQLQRDGLKLGELEEYLHARHAPEANRIIAQRNPGQPGLQDGGSGMMTQDALNYMASLPAGLRQKLDAAAQRVDDIIKNTRQMYVDYELESQDTINSWDNMFQHYIPLQREDKDGAPGLGQGFSIKGREAKGRTGSTRKVVDILANIALQRERAIVRGEKNRVSQALHGLAAANPNPGFWEVDVVPTERVFNPNTGLVEDRADPLYKSRENAVIAKIKDANGKVREHAVLFNEEDERAMRMAAALKNLDAAQLEGLLGVSAKISRYFASVNTSLNPVFGIVNLARDVQAALLNLSSTPLANDRAKIARYTLSAIRGIYADMRAARKGQNPGSQWAALWDDFASTGGQTGYREMFATSADRSKAIQKALDPDAWMNSRLGKIFTINGALKVPVAQARRAAKWLFDWLSDYNETFENGVRLAAYKAGLERGLSKDQAASIAKNISVNFNRKGQVALQAGALYAFFNASIQGTARIGQTLFDMDAGKPKTLRLSAFGKKVVYGGMLLGSMQAMLLAAAGFNDDDPPEFVRERSLVLPIGGGKYITVPMPLGFHLIPAIGRVTTEFALSGFKDPHKRAVSMISMFADALNPIGNAGLSMQTLAPTALDPLVALTENKDYTGKPIARESSNKAIPGHALGRDTATSMAKFLSEAINTLSGGNEYRAGVFSPTPDQLDFLWGQVTGGVGRELSKVEQSTLAVARGEALPTYKVPLVGRFVGDAKSQASEGTAFYANTERLNELETEIKGLQKDGKFAEAAELRRSRSDSYLITMANQAERQIQRLRQQKRELIKAGAEREKIAAIEDQVTNAMARLNRAAESLREKQEN